MSRMCGLAGRSGCRICEKTDFYGPSDWCAATLSALPRGQCAEATRIGAIGELSLDLPETAFDTDGLWFDLPEELVDKLNKMTGLHPMGASRWPACVGSLVYGVRTYVFCRVPVWRVECNHRDAPDVNLM